MALFGKFGKFIETGVKSGIDQITGASGARAAIQAGQIQADELRGAQDLFTPIIESGARQIPALEDSATAEGYGSSIGDIISSGALNPLIDERQRAATQVFASSGLRRSGERGRAAGDITADTVMQLENELNRRRQNLVGAGQQGAERSAQLSSMIGEVLAGGKLGAQQSRARGTKNIIGIGRNILGSIFG